MATVAQNFYPHTTDQDQAWGNAGDVFKLDTAIGAVNSTTQITYTNVNGSAKYAVTVDPYEAISAAAASDNRTNMGWAWNEDVTDADAMDSETNAERFVPAGTWSFTVRVRTGTPGPLTTINVDCEWSVYRVAAGGGSRSLLFTATSSNSSTTGTNVEHTLTQTASPGRIDLAAGETLHVAYRIGSHATNGVLSTQNNVVIVYTGTQTSVTNTVQVPSPGIRTDHKQSATLTGRGTAAKGALPVTMTRSATGRGTATFTKAVTATRSFALTGRGAVSRVLAAALPRSASGRGLVSFTRATVASKSFTLTGRGAVNRDGLVAVLLPRTLTGRGTVTAAKAVTASKTFTLVGRGIVAFTKATQAQRSFTLTGKGAVTRVLAGALPRSATGRGTASFTKAVTAAKSFSLVGKGTAARTVAVAIPRSTTGKGIITEVHPVQAFRTFTLTGRGTVNGRIELPIDEIPTADTTIIRRVVNIWED